MTSPCAPGRTHKDRSSVELLPHRLRVRQALRWNMAVKGVAGSALLTRHYEGSTRPSNLGVVAAKRLVAEVLKPWPGACSAGIYGRSARNASKEPACSTLLAVT